MASTRVQNFFRNLTFTIRVLENNKDYPICSSYDQEYITAFIKILKALKSDLQAIDMSSDQDMVKIYLDLIIMQLHIVELREVCGWQEIDGFSKIKYFTPERIPSCETGFRNFFNVAEILNKELANYSLGDEFQLDIIQNSFAKFINSFHCIKKNKSIEEIFSKIELKMQEFFSAKENLPLGKMQKNKHIDVLAALGDYPQTIFHYVENKKNIPVCEKKNNENEKRKAKKILSYHKAV